MSHYFIIKALQVEEKNEDLLSGFFFENKAEGVSEELSFTQLDDEYTVQTIDKKVKDLNIYFSEPPQEGLILKAQTLFPEVHFELAKMENKDWLAEWKKKFKEFELTSGIKVVPSWLKPQNPKNINIFIDPGMAFGTGTHDTTQIAAGLLSSLPLQQMSVADIGTGTAILAILCEKMGASQVEATEIDDDARAVAKENVQINNCTQTLVRDDQIEDIKTQYDVVIANIIDGVLIKIQNPLRAITKKQGHLVLTGILDEREAHFNEKFNLAGFKLVQRVQQNEWVGLLLKKV